MAAANIVAEAAGIIAEDTEVDTAVGITANSRAMGSNLTLK